MRRSCVLGLLIVMLAGCAKVADVTPQIQTQMLTDMKNGNAVLDCNIACSGAWFFGGTKDLHNLYMANDWQGLGTRVLQIGFQVDLAYFYLGRAAEGIGADDAALRYYRISGALATGNDASLKCSTTTCTGINLPGDLYPRIQAVQANIDRKSAPTAAPATPSAPVTKPKPKNKPADDWITPPPVTR